MKVRTSLTAKELRSLLNSLFKTCGCEHGGTRAHCCYTGSEARWQDSHTLEFKCWGTSEYCPTPDPWGYHLTVETSDGETFNISVAAECNQDNCVCSGCCPPELDELLRLLKLDPNQLRDELSQRIINRLPDLPLDTIIALADLTEQY